MTQLPETEHFEIVDYPENRAVSWPRYAIVQKPIARTKRAMVFSAPASNNLQDMIDRLPLVEKDFVDRCYAIEKGDQAYAARCARLEAATKDMSKQGASLFEMMADASDAFKKAAE